MEQASLTRGFVPPRVPARERPLKIASLYSSRPMNGRLVSGMNLIRYIRIAEALSRRGHEVHLVHDGSIAGALPHAGLREVAPAAVRWSAYDVIKTVFHSGFAALDEWGGADHPFIISALGSVVGDRDEEGVYFYGGIREGLWRIQQRVAQKSRVVALLTEQNAALFRRMHGDRDNRVMVPGGVDAEVPGPASNPYEALGIAGPVALFAGNIYARDRQPEVNLFWQSRLNTLGSALARRGVRLVAMGPGATDHLDANVVTHVGLVDYRDIWDWHWHANVGVVLAQGAVQDNESSKIYYYLRTGLLTACEAPVPNARLITALDCGAVVGYDEQDLTALADATAFLARQRKPARDVMNRMVADHSWDARVGLYANALAAARAD